MLGIGNDLVRSSFFGEEITIATIPSLVAWYKFNTGQTVTAGNTVSAWDNAEGTSGLDLVQPTEAKQPAYSSGAVRFDGSDDLMRTDTIDDTTLTDNFTIMAAIKTTDTSTNNQTLWSGSFDGNGKNFFRYDQTNWKIRPRAGAGSQATINHTLTNDELFLLTIVGTPSGSTINIAIRDNGVDIGNANCSAATNSNSFIFDRIGDHNQTGQLWKGEINEFIIFNETLSVKHMTSFEDDIMDRNGIS